MRDELEMTKARDFVRHNNTANLFRNLELNPQYCMSRDCWGTTPLHWAALFSKKEAIDMPIAAGANLNEVCKTE
jgi:ankyrin repeat protein